MPNPLLGMPYYSDGNATLFLGDSRVVLPALQSLTVQLLVTDPPYGVGYKSNRGRDHERISGDDGSLDVSAVLAQSCKLLGRGRHAYVFGPREFVKAPLTAAVDLVWDKGIVGMGDLSCPWSQSHEPITFAVYEPSQANRAKGYGNLAARMRQGSVLRVPRMNGAATTRHPTEKPVLLLRQLIESSSVMGETVLDPFAGVGSTLVASTLEGRKSVGVEIDERYCEIAAQRLAAISKEKCA
jgi:site-specific DNA-methyltransferase (adenine-specific)